MIHGRRRGHIHTHAIDLGISWLTVFAFGGPVLSLPLSPLDPIYCLRDSQYIELLRLKVSYNWWQKLLLLRPKLI